MAGKVSGKLVAVSLALFFLAGGVVGAAFLARSKNRHDSRPKEVPTKSETAQAGAGRVGAHTRPESPNVHLAEKQRQDRKQERSHPSGIKPYPYQLPPPDWTATVKKTWRSLQKPISLQFDDTDLLEILLEISKQSGLSLVRDPLLPEEMRASFHMQGVRVMGALDMLCELQELAYEILDDGSIVIGRKDRIRGNYPQNLAKAKRVRDLLQHHLKAQKHLAQGWDGVSFEHPKVTALRSKQIKISIENGTVEQAVQTLHNQSGATIWVTANLQKSNRLKRFRIDLSAEQSMENQLKSLCRQSGLGYYWFAQKNAIMICTPEGAKEAAAKEQHWIQNHQSLVNKLDRPFPHAGQMSLPALANAIEGIVGAPVVPSRALWESTKSYQVPTGGTCRELLEALAEQSNLKWGAYLGNGVFLAK